MFQICFDVKSILLLHSAITVSVSLSSSKMFKLFVGNSRDGNPTKMKIIWASTFSILSLSLSLLCILRTSH